MMRKLRKQEKARAPAAHLESLGCSSQYRRLGCAISGYQSMKLRLFRSLTRSSLRLLLATLLLLTALLFSMCTLSISGTHSREFELSDLFLQESSFPEDWGIIATDPHKACSSSPLGSGCPTYGERVTYTLHDTQKWVSETIFQFRDEVGASEDFDDALSSEFLAWPDEQPWAPAPDLPAQFPTASRQYIACRAGPIGRECGLAAQYEEFIIIFMARQAQLSDAQLTIVAAAIDEHISHLLR